MRISPWTVALAAVTTLAPAGARAEADAPAAEALFREGHKLYAEKRYAEACAKLAESFRLEPATGALLALATCHEAEGKLASAWAEYVETVSRARREGRSDRAEAAQQRVKVLEPKLGRLTVVLGPGAEGISALEVKRDGAVLGAASLGIAVPVDSGEHTVEVSAPGRQPWAMKKLVADGASEVVAVPALAAAPPETDAATPVAPTVAPQPSKAEAADAEPSGGGPLRTLGFVTGAAGLAALGVGTFFGVQAIAKNNDSNANGHCVNDGCDAVGKQSRHDAISAGNASTVLFVAGGVLVAGGVTMVLLGGSTSPSKPGVTASLLGGKDIGGVQMTGRF